MTHLARLTLFIIGLVLVFGAADTFAQTESVAVELPEGLVFTNQDSVDVDMTWVFRLYS